MPAVTLLPLAKFTIDRSLFARSGKERSPDTVSHYATRMQAGDAFPPVVAFNDGQRIYLVDGELRYLAAKRLGLNALETEIRPGSRREARLFGAQANARNGESRSVADRRLAVLMVLEECPDWSVPKTADHCRVSTSLVTGLVEVRARMPSVKAEEASAKSARETLGKPAPQRPTVPVPSVIPSPRAPSLAPKASMPTPRYVPPPLPSVWAEATKPVPARPEFVVTTRDAGDVVGGGRGARGRGRGSRPRNFGGTNVPGRAEVPPVRRVAGRDPEGGVRQHFGGQGGTRRPRQTPGTARGVGRQHLRRRYLRRPPDSPPPTEG